MKGICKHCGDEITEVGADSFWAHTGGLYRGDGHIAEPISAEELVKEVRAEMANLNPDIRPDKEHLAKLLDMSTDQIQSYGAGRELDYALRRAFIQADVSVRPDGSIQVVFTKLSAQALSTTLLKQWSK